MQFLPILTNFSYFSLFAIKWKTCDNGALVTSHKWELCRVKTMYFPSSTKLLLAFVFVFYLYLYLDILKGENTERNADWIQKSVWKQQLAASVETCQEGSLFVFWTKLLQNTLFPCKKKKKGRKQLHNLQLTVLFSSDSVFQCNTE